MSPSHPSIFASLSFCLVPVLRVRARADPPFPILFLSLVCSLRYLVPHGNGNATVHRVRLSPRDSFSFPSQPSRGRHEAKIVLDGVQGPFALPSFDASFLLLSARVRPRALEGTALTLRYLPFAGVASTARSTTLLQPRSTSHDCRRVHQRTRESLFLSLSLFSFEYEEENEDRSFVRSLTSPPLVLLLSSLTVPLPPRRRKHHRNRSHPRRELSFQDGLETHHPHSTTPVRHPEETSSSHTRGSILSRWSARAGLVRRDVGEVEDLVEYGAECGVELY